MKALSIRQLWAELILQGRKTIELRTWSTTHRGALALHAAQKINKINTENCETYDIDPETLTRGALVGRVDLVDVVELDEAQYGALRDEHLSLKEWTGGLYGWRFKANGVKPQAKKVVTVSGVNL